MHAVTRAAFAGVVFWTVLASHSDIVVPVEAGKKPGRIPWATSKITGTPERPHPYKAERVFPKLSFDEPLYMVHAPGIDRWFVGQRRGKIFSFPKNPEVEKADLFCDLPAEIKSWDPTSNVKQLSECYALVFHPQFQKNRYCYVCYILTSKTGEQLPDGTRIARFRVTDTNPPRIDPASEKVLLTFLGGGHNGCDLHFGNDGMLYISTGDGASPNPPDKYDTGQDCSDLLSSILRIDVDKTDAGLNYAVPKDNPFVGRPNLRGEIYAYGFRNPWRMSFDRPTGDLWVGDVGWELWELVDRVQKGGNYGWSIKEGNQDVRPSAKRGPTPVLPPTLAFPHTEAASITGGFVYHGKKFPELEGAYICGDWVSRKVWATKFDGDRIVWHKEIAQTNAKIVSFGEDVDGELYLVDHDNPAGLYTLVPNPAAKDWTDSFPRKLSETGLYSSTKEHTLATGVRKLGIREPQWMDHAAAERFLAMPGTDTARMYDEFLRNDDAFFGSYVFPPKDTVLGKTISMEMKHGEPSSAKRLETQILHFDGSQWRGYTYVWNDTQTDAELLDAKGKDIVLEPIDAKAPGGRRKQTWHFPSRTECMTCHNPWAGFALAFTPFQLQHAQVKELVNEGFLETVTRKKGKDLPTTVDKLPSFGATPTNIDGRAREYLHVNCAHCHQFGAGGTADIELRFDKPLARTKTVNARPNQGMFGIPEAKLIAPGHPARSVLYYRMAKLGHGRMPHVGSSIVDEEGLSLIYQWIRRMDPHPEASELIAKLPLQSKAERAKNVAKLLDSTDTALALMDALDARNEQRAEIVALAMAHPNPLVRDLFERFAPPEQRSERLGTAIEPQKLLALSGNADRGRELFFSPASQCASCHRVAGKGGQLGPDLSDVAKRLSKTQIIESLLTPSKTIEPKYLTHAVETNAGQVHTGLLVEKTAKEMVMRVLGDKEVRVPIADIAATHTLKTSLMPDNLLRDATVIQAGDLLAYLWSLDAPK